MKLGKRIFIHNCPVTNWEVYLSRRLDLYGFDSGYRWTMSQAMMCAAFKSVVLEALRKASRNTVWQEDHAMLRSFQLPRWKSTVIRPKK